ncbi:MAG: LptF/LptG family permease [Elusimicrobiota bacterium]
MKIIKKYVLYSFLRPFLTGLAAFLFLMILTHFFDFLHTFLEHKPPLGLLLTYFGYRIPNWLVNVTPVATLLGVLFSLGTLNRHHELTAIKSSGIKLIYVLKQLILFSLLLSILSGIINESIVPATNARAENLFSIIKQESPEKTVYRTRKNFTYLSANRKLFFIQEYTDLEINGLKVIEFYSSSSREKKMITSEKAIYNGSEWVLLNGTIRNFTKQGEIESFTGFDKKIFSFDMSPENISKPETKPEEMGFISLLKYIKKLEKGGFSATKEKVLLHHKIAFPFSNTIILILGIPLALWGGMKSRTTGFFISLVICFIYWGAISVGRALGQAEVLPPAVGAWSANLIFLLISIIMLKVSKIL